MFISMTMKIYIIRYNTFFWKTRMLLNGVGSEIFRITRPSLVSSVIKLIRRIVCPSKIQNPIKFQTMYQFRENQFAMLEFRLIVQGILKL